MRHTSSEVTPFRHVEPFKRHFLVQMEYTGAGRAIPEHRADVKTVRIGFLGPIEPTVSVATGGRSHEECWASRCCRALSWRSRRRMPGVATSAARFLSSGRQQR